MRYTRRIEVGTYEDKIGFTLYFDNDTKEHFLFSPVVAEALAKKLLGVVEEVAQFERMFEEKKPTGDGVSASDVGGITIV